MPSITKHALIARINRKLKTHGSLGQTLRTSRGVQSRLDLGDHYIQDLHTSLVVAQDVELMELGRELGVLRPHEVVRD